MYIIIVSYIPSFSKLKAHPVPSIVALLVQNKGLAMHKQKISLFQHKHTSIWNWRLSFISTVPLLGINITKACDIDTSRILETYCWYHIPLKWKIRDSIRFILCTIHGEIQLYSSYSFTPRFIFYFSSYINAEGISYNFICCKSLKEKKITCKISALCEVKIALRVLDTIN
jgi:hypothetical protein